MPDSSNPPVAISTEDTASALAAKFRPIAELVPYARNSRTHSEAQVAQIAASIVEFGFTNPVLADATGIVAGHGRVLGARKVYDSGQAIRLPNGLQIPRGTVPVIDCTGWSEAKRRAYIIADNQLALNAGWDMDLLKVEIGELEEIGFELDLLGFGEDFVTTLLSDAEPADEGEGGGDEDDDAEARIIHCPKCGHDFSILEQMTKQGRRRNPKKAA